jgi:hypothetical protein
MNNQVLQRMRQRQTEVLNALNRIYAIDCETLRLLREANRR